MNERDKYIRIAEAIETPRLLLRRPQVKDTTMLINLFCDEQVKRYLGGALLPQVAEERIERIFRAWENLEGQVYREWVICKKGQDEAIGLCSLGPFENEIEVAYMLTPAMWGKGYATEAANANLTYGFQKLQLERIIGVTQEANHGSQYVLEKLGMHHVCNLWKWEAPQRLYELTRTKWLIYNNRKLF